MFKNLIMLCGLIAVLATIVSCCGKQVPDLPNAYSVIHPLQQESAFFVVRETKFPHNMEGGMTLGINTGSGAVIKSGKGWSDILTAGHVCYEPDDFPFKTEYHLRSVEGRIYSGTVISIDMEKDLCLIRIDYRQPPLILAERNPNLGEKVFMAGYPQGVYAPGVLHFFEGYYSGMNDTLDSIYNFPASPGSSGGPIVNSTGEIIGVVSAIIIDFNNIVIGPGRESIESFLVESAICSKHNRLCFNCEDAEMEAILTLPDEIKKE